jgi:uncharacterized membrane protein
VAALQSVIEGHAAWAGKVRGLMVNGAAAGVGIPGCSKVTALPLLQDAPGDPLETAFGAAYNDFVVVDGAGVIRHRLQAVTLSSDPSPLVTAVEGLL